MMKKTIDLFLMLSAVVFVVSFVLLVGALTFNAKGVYAWTVGISLVLLNLSWGLDAVYARGFEKGIDEKEQTNA